MCRVEFFKIGKRDVTFIREMRVLHFITSTVSLFATAFSGIGAKVNLRSPLMTYFGS